MSDTAPNNRGVAYLAGLILHPANLAIVTLLILLWGLPIVSTIVWTATIASVILIPIFLLIAYLRRDDRHTYQRFSRKPIYLLTWVNVVICLMLIVAFDGPEVLGVCMATLLVWLPLQLLINQYVTKISIHTAVISGCFSALFVLGKLTLGSTILAVILILIVAWARIQTKNHTLTQVTLGGLLGMVAVFIVFPFYQSFILTYL